MIHKKQSPLTLPIPPPLPCLVKEFSEASEEEPKECPMHDQEVPSAEPLLQAVPSPTARHKRERPRGEEEVQHCQPQAQESRKNAMAKPARRATQLIPETLLPSPPTILGKSGATWQVAAEAANGSKGGKARTFK